MKLGIVFETFTDDEGKHNHVEVGLLPSMEEFQKALADGDPAAAWIQVLLDAMKQNSAGVHHYNPGQTSEKPQ